MPQTTSNELVGKGRSSPLATVHSIRTPLAFARAGLGHIAGREIERTHLRAGPRQHDRGHAVTAAIIEGMPSPQIAEFGESGADPGLVIEEVVVPRKPVPPARLKTHFPLGRLPVVELLFGDQAVDRGHGAA